MANIKVNISHGQTAAC